MKIAYIGQKGIPTAYGGVERHVEGLSTQMAKLGHEVFVYARPYYTKTNLKKYKKVNIINLPSLRTKHFDAISHTLIASLHALFKRYDIIHYHGVGPSLLAFIPRIFKPTAKVITTFHCLDRKHEKWNWLAKKFLTWGEWAACKFSHQTIAVSQDIADYCLTRYHRRAVYLPNAVALPDRGRSTDKIKKFGLKSKSYFVIVSRLIQHKNIEEAIRVFAENPELKLVIVGDGFYTDDYVKKIKSLAKGCENIIFTGNQTGEALEQLYRNALAFVLPSRNEGLSISVLEAMSHKLPVIVRNIPGHQEFIRQRLVIHYKTENQLARIVKNLTAKPEPYFKVGAKAFCFIKENYSWDKVARETDYLYGQFFNGPSLVTMLKRLFNWK